MKPVYPQKVIRTPEEFTPKYRRFLRPLIGKAVNAGALHERGEEWLDDAIGGRHARGFINDGRITGFCVLRHFQYRGEGNIYVEACLWKEEFRSQTQHMLIEEARRMGTVMYGAVYERNAGARDFYLAEHGYHRITPQELPAAVMCEVGRYLDQVILLRNRLEDTCSDTRNGDGSITT